MGCDFLEVSAKTNKNVEESFHTLLSSIYEKEGWNSVDTTTLSPAGSCSVLLQIIAFCNLIFGALQIVGGLSKPVREYPPDQHITNNWVSYLRVGIGLYIVIVSIGGWIAASKRRRDMLHGYAISMLVVFLVTLVVGVVWQNTLFVFPDNELGAVEWYVSVFMQFVGMILAYYNSVHGKENGSNTIMNSLGSPDSNDFGRNDLYKNDYVVNHDDVIAQQNRRDNMYSNSYGKGSGQYYF